MNAPRPKQGFPSSSRLRRRADFLDIQQAVQQGSGRRVGGACYLLLARRRSAAAEGASPSNKSRLGVTVSRKVGNAVERNRVKRWVRESYRTLPALLRPAGTDLVVIARTGASHAGLAATREELSALLRRLRP